MSDRLAGGTRRPTSSTEILNVREAQWEPRLRASSLVIEVDVPDDHSDQVAVILGGMYAKYILDALEPADMFARWPACTAVAMTAIASRDYEQGRFWPHLWEAVDYDGEPADQTFWGDGFRQSLDILWMPRLPDAGLHHVGPILMHTGIPVYCVEDFLNLLLHRMVADPGLDAETLLAWAQGPTDRLGGVDRPVARFLQTGSDYAYDVVDRSLDLLQRLRSSEPDLAGLGLPRRLVAKALQLVEDGAFQLGPAKRRTSRSGSEDVLERPRLRFDPFGTGIQIAVPAVPDAPDGVAVWTLNADGNRLVHRSEAAWYASGAGAPAAGVPVSAPARTVVVSNGRDTTEISMIDPQAPQLVFTERGRHLPAGTALPQDAVWLIHPETLELSIDGPSRLIAEADMVGGWRGWNAQLHHLDGVRSVTLAPGVTREVRGFQRPRIDIGALIPGLSAASGAPVASQSPTVWLPPSPSAPVEWTVEVRGPNETVARTVMTADTAATADVWANVDRPLLGTYDIAVRGPLGRGTHRTVFIADKTEVRYVPGARSFNSGGVVAGRAVITTPVGVSVSSTDLTFAPAELTATVEFIGGAHRERVTVTPPHPTVLHDGTSATTGWSAGPLHLTTEDLEQDPGTLLVRLAEDSVMRALHVVAGGMVVQELAPRRVAAATGRYLLTHVADTIAHYRHADLVLESDSGTMPLAFVRPRQLAASVRYTQDRLVLEKAAPIVGLAAGIYATRAPWRPPSIVAIEDGSAPLPADLRNAGPLHVLLQIQSPWTYTDWPRWPTRYLSAGGGGHLRSPDAEETALSRFLAGDGPFPGVVEDLSKVWPLADLAERLKLPADVTPFLDEIAACLRARPTAALKALEDACPNADRAAVAIVGTGLAAVAAEPDASTTDPRLWATQPLGAALLGSDLSGDVDLFHAALTQCGSALTDITQHGIDPFAAVGRFGPETDALTRMPPEQFAALLARLNIVPQKLLDEDSRTAAALQLFEARMTGAARAAALQSKSVVGAVLTLLRGRPSQLAAAVQARVHPSVDSGWVLLPAMSMALAVTARLAARGVTAAMDLERRYRVAWRQLAVAAPALTAIDLVLAELHAAFTNRRTE